MSELEVAPSTTEPPPGATPSAEEEPSNANSPPEATPGAEEPATDPQSESTPGAEQPPETAPGAEKPTNEQPLESSSNYEKPAVDSILIEGSPEAESPVSDEGAGPSPSVPHVDWAAREQATSQHTAVATPEENAANGDEPAAPKTAGRFEDVLAALKLSETRAAEQGLLSDEDEEGELETEADEDGREEDGNEEEAVIEEEFVSVDWGLLSESADGTGEYELEEEGEEGGEGESVGGGSDDSYDIPALVPDLFYQMNPQYIPGDILALMKAEAEAEEEDYEEEGIEEEKSFEEEYLLAEKIHHAALGEDALEEAGTEEREEEAEILGEEGEGQEDEAEAEETGEGEEEGELEQIEDETTDFDEMEIESDLVGEEGETDEMEEEEEEGKEEDEEAIEDDEGKSGEGEESEEPEGEEEKSTVSGEETPVESPSTTTPSRSGESTEPEVEEEEEESVNSEENLQRILERNALEQQLRALALQKQALTARNQCVQQRLHDYFQRRTDDLEREKNVGELEARYTKYLCTIRDQQRVVDDECARRLRELHEFRARIDAESALVAEQYEAVVQLRRQVALKSRSTRTGRLMPAAEVDALLGRETSKEVEVAAVRLESLRRESRVLRLEKAIKESEELAGGIHLIDFEQLKIENQTFAEKIEERNEDLSKLRRKISNTVQIMTHLKERIQFEQGENEERERRLQAVVEEVTRRREALAQLKQGRDKVRHRTTRQRADAGLLGHEALLRDFEQRVDEEARLQRALTQLQRDYAANQQLSQRLRRAGGR